MNRAPCSVCDGARLKPEILAVTIKEESGREANIHQFCELTIAGAAQFVRQIELSEQQRAIVSEVLHEISSRLEFLLEVGLDYLTLNRESGTLSGGEAQRIRLATQIGSGLAGVLYVLDEPSIGLHQRDNARLIGTLRRLRDLGNSVIVVEHDEETIRSADYILDLGPGAGPRGGEIVAAGPLEEILEAKNSPTAAYLSGRSKIAIPRQRIAPRSLNSQSASGGSTLNFADGWLTILGATENNLKNITVRIPLGCLTCVTGVSGSGKSTLVDDILRRALFRHFYNSKDKPGEHRAIQGLDQIDKAIIIDQSAIGRTPRSNPVTYTGAFTPIRELFSQLPASRIRGYSAGRFSFNVKGGRCENCQGDGLIKIEMHFLADAYAVCEVCQGKRYNRETLEITYKGKNIADVLALTVDEASRFFRNVPTVADKLSALQDVGLGYLRLGQAATTLSGGEAQRVKLATELAKKATGRTLYILDEPTTGLHFADIEKLLQVLMKLRDTGNTLVVIEHNLEMIKCADWVIDLGPEGGEEGGRIVAEGTPEEIARSAGQPYGRASAGVVRQMNRKLLALAGAIIFSLGTEARCATQPGLAGGRLRPSRRACRRWRSSVSRLSSRKIHRRLNKISRARSWPKPWSGRAGRRRRFRLFENSEPNERLGSGLHPCAGPGGAGSLAGSAAALREGGGRPGTTLRAEATFGAAQALQAVGREDEAMRRFLSLESVPQWSDRVRLRRRPLDDRSAAISPRPIVCCAKPSRKRRRSGTRSGFLFGRLNLAQGHPEKAIETLSVILKRPEGVSHSTPDRHLVRAGRCAFGGQDAGKRATTRWRNSSIIALTTRRCRRSLRSSTNSTGWSASHRRTSCNVGRVIRPSRGRCWRNGISRRSAAALRRPGEGDREL